MTGEPAYLSIECKSYKTLEDLSVKILVKAFSGEHEIVLYVTSDTDGTSLKIVPLNISGIRNYIRKGQFLHPNVIVRV
ncbi:hypothetical protein NIES1031_05920 [Chroogloeocystis siderophila 5.2 s.c.1]|jgi:hypothetical protein|uniref:Uncharacterized protein n=1 Tax=Chroogloeocystis siderophila 5.2 s.c.1 TaxID=247279 RepID=A0A1U7HWW7_9CHRO|nr:hypothetical protein NIES1031_05920 [Chroogloeocystis siderophila 5.2 s.c.1]